MATLEISPLPAWTDVYLTALAQHGMEHTAAAEAGTTVRAVRALVERNQEFAYAVDDALERSADVVEAELRRRAIQGVEKGIYYQGERVATEQNYSDTLLIELARAKRRREFGTKQEISGPGGTPLIVQIRSFDEEPPAEAILVPDGEQTPIEDASFTPQPLPAAELAGLDANDFV